jgi:predicted dithiol-disulfide oxidoreductase (DUF899 family)
MNKPKPEIVTADEWQQHRDELLAAEKELTHANAALAARRRRLGMAEFTGRYTFSTPDGDKSLLELFDGRDQLVVYQFMDEGPEGYCPGCTWFTNNVPADAPAMLAERGITYCVVSDMPLEQIERYKTRMGWTMPFVSSRGTTFADDCGAGAGFMITVFFRDSDTVYRTYNTTARGIEMLAFTTGVLDRTVYGREEEWEDSPSGWPQHATYDDPVVMEPQQVSTGFGTHT